ncbi:MAG: pyridoxal phosphate-dependent aminotransferase [Candidatus Cyclobacteriaceae bacterium M3_2C_046]
MIISTARRLKNLKEYYFSIKLKEVRGLKEQGRDVINMGVGSPDLAPSPATIEALAEAASNPENHGYQPYKGIAPLRQAMADWYRNTYQVRLDPDHEILPLMGSKEGITHISMSFLDPGDEVLLPELGYPTYQAVTEMVEAKARLYPLNQDWEPDFKALSEQDLSRVKLMWVNYPHMPTGKPANRALFEKIVEFARTHNILVCHDNPYSLILNDTSPLSLLAIPGAKDVCLELNSMSKSHNMAGWRVGWISGDRSYLEQIIKVKSNVDSGMFFAIQYAAVKAFENPLSWHQEQNKIYRERREVVYQFLDQLECNYNKDQTGMFVWAEVNPAIKSVEKLVDHILYQYNLFITPGFIFGTRGQRFIRISLCNDKEVLLRALDRIKSLDVKKLSI